MESVERITLKRKTFLYDCTEAGAVKSLPSNGNPALGTQEILLPDNKPVSPRRTSPCHPGEQVCVTRENKFALSEAVTEMVRSSKMYNQYS